MCVLPVHTIGARKAFLLKDVEGEAMMQKLSKVTLSSRFYFSFSFFIIIFWAGFKINTTQNKVYYCAMYLNMYSTTTLRALGSPSSKKD